MTVQAIMTSLLSHLLLPSLPLDTSTDTRAFVKREALLLCHLSGGPGAAEQELLYSLYAVALSKEWSEGHARIVACRAYFTHEDVGDKDG
jgi:telomere length regulation protein